MAERRTLVPETVSICVDQLRKLKTQKKSNLVIVIFIS